jgi:O-antigen ligase
MVTDKQIQKVYLALLVAIFFVPLIFWPKLYNAFSSTKVLMFWMLVDVLGVLWIYLAVRTDEFSKLRRDPIVLALLVFVFIQIVSSLLGVDQWNSFFGDLRRYSSILMTLHLSVYAMAIIFFLRRTPVWQVRFVHLLIVVASLVSVHAVFEWASFVPSLVDFDRASSVFGNPIYLASFLIIPLFLSLGECKKEEGSKRILFAALSLLIFLGILATGTRGALIGLVAGFVVMVVQILLHRGLSKRVPMVTAIIIVLVFGSMYLIGQNSAEESILYRITHFSGENVSSRLAYWNLGIQGSFDAPLLGVGNENYYIVADKNYQAEDYGFDDTWIDKPHNYFVELLVTNGVLGLLSFLVLIGLLLKRSWRTKGYLAPALVAYLAQSLFIFDTISASITFFFLIALIVAQKKREDGEALRWGSKIQVVGTLLICVVLFGFTIPYARTVYALGQSDDLQKASEIIDKQLVVYDYGNVAEVYFNSLLANQFDQDLFEKTEGYYLRAISRHPEQAKLWYQLARLYITQATEAGTVVSEDGVSAADMVLELAPGRINGQYMQVFIVELSGDSEKAIEMAENLYDLFPDDPETIWILAQLYLSHERVDSGLVLAIDALEQKLKLLSSNDLLLLVSLFAERGQYDQVVNVYERAVDMFPSELTLLPGLAASYATIGDTKSAIETAQELMRLDSHSTDAAQAFIESL